MLLEKVMHKYLLEFLFSILLGGIVDHMAMLYLIFWGTSTLFSTVAASFYIPISNAQRFQFLHILSM